MCTYTYTIIHICSKLGFTQRAEKMVFQRFCPAHVKAWSRTATLAWKCPLRADLSWQQFQFTHCKENPHDHHTAIGLARAWGDCARCLVVLPCSFSLLGRCTTHKSKFIRLKSHRSQFRTFHWTLLKRLSFRTCNVQFMRMNWGRNCIIWSNRRVFKCTSIVICACIKIYWNA